MRGFAVLLSFLILSSPTWAQERTQLQEVAKTKVLKVLIGTRVFLEKTPEFREAAIRHVETYFDRSYFQRESIEAWSQLGSSLGFTLGGTGILVRVGSILAEGGHITGGPGAIKSKWHQALRYFLTHGMTLPQAVGDTANAALPRSYTQRSMRISAAVGIGSILGGTISGSSSVSGAARNTPRSFEEFSYISRETGFERWLDSTSDLLAKPFGLSGNKRVVYENALREELEEFAFQVATDRSANVSVNPIEILAAQTDPMGEPLVDPEIIPALKDLDEFLALSTSDADKVEVPTRLKTDRQLLQYNRLLLTDLKGLIGKTKEEFKAEQKAAQALEKQFDVALSAIDLALGN